MNLIKNVDGTWETAKLRVQQDLDTIQRTINALSARLNAVVIPTPAAPAMISSANTPTTFTTDPLVSVATLPLGALVGDGKVTDALGVNVDGSTITINALNQLVSAGLTTVAVDAAGALSGNGTTGSKLAVKVDGVTISIVGDQLVAAATPVVFLASGVTPTSTITPSGSGTIAAHTVFGTIAAVAGKTIWPIALYLTASQVVTGGGGTGAWNSGIVYELQWNGSFSGYAGPIYTGSLQLFTTGLAGSTGTQLSFPTAAQTATSAASAFQNTALQLRTANAAGVNGSTNFAGTMVNSGSWSLLYVLL